MARESMAFLGSKSILPLTSLVIISRSFTQSNSLQSIDRRVSTGLEKEILHHRGNFPFCNEKNLLLASGQFLIHRSTLQLHEAFHTHNESASQGIQHVCSERRKTFFCRFFHYFLDRSEICPFFHFFSPSFIGNSIQHHQMLA